MKNPKQEINPGDVVMVDLRDEKITGCERGIWMDDTSHANIGIVIHCYGDSGWAVSDLLYGYLVHESHLVKLS